ncbi:MAG: GNAT family N-acetyltransferase [Beijerinckiaceae bacterium]
MPDANAFRISAHTVPPAALCSAMSDLWVAAWSRAMPGIDFEARRPWLLQRIGEWPLVLTLDGEAGDLLGFALLDPHRQWLDQIAVAPAAHGSGAASRLLDEVKARCGACVGLDVNADNHRAVAFYRREGFVAGATGTNPNSGLPVVRMRWTQNVSAPDR